MLETLFVSDNRQIDFLYRKYQAGQRGVAEMCNLFCSGAGRGHVHFLTVSIGMHSYASSPGGQYVVIVPRSSNPHRHEQWMKCCMKSSGKHLAGKTLALLSRRETVSRNALTSVIGQSMTVTTRRIVSFQLGTRPSRRHNIMREMDFSYVDGHKFECQHAASGKRMHHVFVLDCSGSMRGQPWIKLMEALHEYVNNRIAAGASQDVISVLTSSRTVEIVYEARDIMKMRDADVPFRGGETWYSEGLRGAHEVLSRLDSAKFTPVLVIFSDGRPHDPKRVDELGRRIRHSYERVGLQAFMVGAGQANLSYLQRLAQLMGGSYLHALHNTEVKNQFQKISASVGAKMSLAVASRW